MKKLFIVCATLAAFATLGETVMAQSIANRYARKFVLSDAQSTPSLLTLTTTSSLSGAYTLTFPAAVGGSGQVLVTTDANGTLGWTTLGAGTVTAVSVATANGFAGSSSGGSTPALTLSTTIPGMLKGNGTAILAATAGTDYSAGTAGLITGILKSTNGTGALSIATGADLPAHMHDASNITTGTLAIARGGTNSGTALAGGRPMVSSASAIVENNAALTNNTVPTWSTASVGNFANSSITDDGSTVSTTENLALTGAQKTLTFTGDGSGVSTFKAGAQGTTSFNYTLPTSAPTANQVLTATAVSAPNVTLGWATPTGVGTVTSSLNTSDIGTNQPGNNPAGNGQVLVNATGLSFSIGASETWNFDFELSCNSAGGGQGLVFAITFPSGATMEATVVGTNNSATAFQSDRLTTSGTKTTQNFVTYGGEGAVKISGVVVNSTTSGTVQLQIASSGTDNNLKKVYKNSYVVARKM